LLFISKAYFYGLKLVLIPEYSSSLKKHQACNQKLNTGGAFFTGCQNFSFTLKTYEIFFFSKL